MDAPGEVADLADRREQLHGRRVDQFRGALSAGPRLIEPHRKGDEPLLGAVVKVALDPAPLGILGLDDPRPRRADLLELRPDLRREPLVLEREPGHGADGRHSPRVLALDRGVVDEDREQLPVALEAGHSPPVVVGIRQLDGLTVGPDEPLAGRPRERELERRVA